MPSSASELADEAHDAGRVGGATAELEIDGEKFIDISSSDTPLHPDVRRALDDVPVAQRPKWHGRCAEPRCISQALANGVDPAGGHMQAIQIGDVTFNGKVIPHGSVKPVCASCAVVQQAFGVSS